MTQGSKKTAQKKAVEPWKAELAERIGKAFKQYNAATLRGGELSQAELGAKVAKRLGLAKALTQAAVSRWMNPDDPAAPDPPTLEAIAEILSVDKSWLAFGASSD